MRNKEERREKREERRELYSNYKEETDRLYRTCVNRRLKYIALSVIGIAILLLFATIFLHDSISRTTMMFMRGCAGVCAIVFVILLGILVYRVNSAYIRGN